MGASYLPAKNYHVLAAAMMTCNLIQEGVSRKTSIGVQKLVAWAYRTLKMDNIIQTRKDDLDDFKKGYRAYKMLYARRKHAKRGRGSSSFNEKLESFEDWSIRNLEEGNISFPYGSHNAIQSISTRERFIVMQSNSDAARLLSKATIGGDYILFKVPHTNINLNPIDGISSSIRKLMDSDDKSLEPGWFSKPLGWSKERYQRAFDKAQSYLVDWEWTYKQHEAGARFAAEVCQQSDDSNPDDIICPDSHFYECSRNQLIEQRNSKTNIQSIIEFINRDSFLLK